MLHYLTLALRIALCACSLSAISGCATGINTFIEEPGIQSKYVSENVQYKTYVPPDWNGSTPLSMVILLHDRKENFHVFEKSGVVDAFFNISAENRLPESVLIVPDNPGGFWWNYYDGSKKYADFIVRELIPAVQSTFPTRNETRHIHLFGTGTGAMGAVELAFVFPGIFGTVGALNGLYFDVMGAATYVEQNPFINLKRVFGPADNIRAMTIRSVFNNIQTRQDVPETRFVIGNSSFGSWELNQSNELFQEHLLQLDIPHDRVIFHGSDDKQTTRSMIPVFLGLQLGMGNTYGETGSVPYHVLKFR
jgi:hypothetical protein